MIAGSWGKRSTVSVDGVLLGERDSAGDAPQKEGTWRASGNEQRSIGPRRFSLPKGEGVARILSSVRWTDVAGFSLCQTWNILCVALPDPITYTSPFLDLRVGLACHHAGPHGSGRAAATAHARAAETAGLPVRRRHRGGVRQHPGALERAVSSGFARAHLCGGGVRRRGIRLPVPSVVRAVLPNARHDGAGHQRGGDGAAHLPPGQHAVVRPGEPLDLGRHRVGAAPWLPCCSPAPSRATPRRLHQWPTCPRRRSAGCSCAIARVCS